MGSLDDSAGEFAVLDWLRARLPQAGGAETYAGDDAAVLEPPPGMMLLATDLAVEQVHFDLGLCSLEDAGWRSLAANVSDVAAMGGRPLHAVAAVAAPRSGSDLESLLDGLALASEHFGVRLVGGDLSTSRSWFVSVAITGTCEPGLAPVLRSGARPGDRLFVTGPLGAAAAGLAALRAGRAQEAGAAESVRAYRRPEARVREGQLAARLGATAMIDVSDGLVRDLGHIADESGVGFELLEAPVAPGASEPEALTGGDDYELVFTVRGGVDVTGPFEGEGLRPPIEIGRCTARPGERRLRGTQLPLSGWEHIFGGSDIRGG